ncbi:hypothetical protein IV203_011054 [Nitzschia inconspicua]|uniref:Uncharacterized protein n=1 Tax=Nitzschia inconspicua TaxID=303405 RepID=A0A9K3P8R4_9STRA|nr:hypothetical protein IV203_011054 [Nitzschia inconspicua]
MTWSQSYPTKLGLGGSYGHKFKEVMIPELVRFDGALIRDGLLGGATDGAIYRRWKPDDAGYDQYIGASLTHTRFLQLKRVWKLNDNQLRKCRIYNKSFKYWHSSKNHALAMAVVIAYDMYLECTTETP